jgi:phage terminase large subunit-like protein
MPRNAPASWNTSCLDWEERILTGRSLVPELPLYEAQAAKALRVFKRLKLPDVIGTPTMEEACGPWFFPIVEGLFGSYDPATNTRHISEVFQLIPKGNSKSSNGGAVMLTALIMNRRPEAFLFIAPTMEIASIAFAGQGHPFGSTPNCRRYLCARPYPQDHAPLVATLRSRWPTPT